MVIEFLVLRFSEDHLLLRVVFGPDTGLVEKALFLRGGLRVGFFTLLTLLLRFKLLLELSH